MKKWYALLQKYERLALSDKTIASLLDDIYWPKLQWVRMILVGLYEAQFKFVPAWVYQKVLSAWKGLTYTKPTEDMNRVLRNLEKSRNMNLHASRQSRWYALATSKVRDGMFLGSASFFCFLLPCHSSFLVQNEPSFRSFSL